MPATYSKIVVDIGTAGARQPVLTPGNGIESVTIVRCPVGADVELHIGQAADSIPIAEGDSFGDLCGVDTGLFLSVNTASPGNTVTLVVFFSAGILTRGV